MYLLGFWRRWVLLSDAGKILGETMLDPAVPELYTQFAGIQQGTFPSPVLQLIKTHLSPHTPSAAPSNSSETLFVEYPAMVPTIQTQFHISIKASDDPVFQQFRSRSFRASDLPEIGLSQGFAHWQLRQKQQTSEKILTRLVGTYQRFDRTVEYYRKKMVEATMVCLPQLMLKKLPPEDLETAILGNSERKSPNSPNPFHQFEIQSLKMIATLIRNLLTQQSQLEKSISSILATIAPNLGAILGNVLAAELLARAGGLANLARLPAGRIQLLGSKAPRSPDRNPKYGILYKATIIGQVPGKTHARLARSLSAVIAIAVKADFYTHSFIAEALNAKLAKRIRRLRGK